MGDPVQALRYLKFQLTLYALILLCCMRYNPPFHISQANPRVDCCSGPAPIPGKGNRKGRQSSETSSLSDDPLGGLVDHEVLASGESPLIGPEAARELDRKKKDSKEVENEKDDKGSLNIRIHLDLHAKVRLDLEADLYGDIVIGLL